MVGTFLVAVFFVFSLGSAVNVQNSDDKVVGSASEAYHRVVGSTLAGFKAGAPSSHKLND